METYLIVIIAVAAGLLLLFAFALLCDKMVFGRRADKNPLLKYFTAEDFGLTAQSVSLPKGLKGFVYSEKEATKIGKLIIFCHGMGPGHIAYTTEIAYFCNLGYKVLAVDSRGCNFSDGKSIKGMYSGVETVIAAIDFAKKNKDGLFGESPEIYLVGHSWGAYSALCASAKRKVEGVVAISSPCTPSKTIQEGAAGFISKPLSVVLRPFWWLVGFLKYGAKGNSNAAHSAMKNGAPTLIIHGDKDKVVSSVQAVYYKAEGENITKLFVNGKAHNPYNTENAERLLSELSARLRKGEKDFGGFDFTAATEEDEEVMRTIAQFIENN